MDDRSYELSHHGILGQKWGRQQGPPYPLDSSDHSASERKAGWRKSLDKDPRGRSSSGSNEKMKPVNFIQKAKEKHLEFLAEGYRKQGMNEQEAREAAEKFAELEKKVAIGAAVAAGTVVAVYVAREIGKNYLDETIKAGTTMQTLSLDENRINNGKAFYSAFRESDMAKYQANFGTEGDLAKYNIRYAATKNLKIASPKKAEKVYEQLFAENEEFANAVNESLSNVKKYQGDYTDYEMFNSFSLLNGKSSNLKAQKMYFDKLKELGYSGVQDVNDRVKSGFNTKSNIIFDTANIKLNGPAQKLTSSEIDRAKKIAEDAIREEAKQKAISEQIEKAVFSPKNVAKAVGGGSAATLLGGGAKISMDVGKRKKSRR